MAAIISVIICVLLIALAAVLFVKNIINSMNGKCTGCPHSQSGGCGSQSCK